MKMTNLDTDRILEALQLAKGDDVPVLSNCIWAAIRQEEVSIEDFAKAMNIVTKQKDKHYD